MNTIKPIEIAIRVYTAILNQTGTGAPVATVLHNTLEGDIVWTRIGSGQYRGTLAGAFPAAKTAAWINGQVNDRTVITGWLSDNIIYILQSEIESPFGPVDGLTKAYIEIRVYNQN